MDSSKEAARISASAPPRAFMGGAKSARRAGARGYTRGVDYCIYCTTLPEVGLTPPLVSSDCVVDRGKSFS